MTSTVSCSVLRGGIPPAREVWGAQKGFLLFLVLNKVIHKNGQRTDEQKAHPLLDISLFPALRPLTNPHCFSSRLRTLSTSGSGAISAWGTGAQALKAALPGLPVWS